MGRGYPAGGAFQENEAIFQVNLGMKYNRDLYVHGVKVPRLMLGTSPFLGAGQFGHRAMEYRRLFYENPENMTELIAEAANFGIPYVQALGDEIIAKAIDDARELSGKDIQVVGSVGMYDFDQELEIIRSLNAKIILTHAFITDRLDDYFGKCIDEISNTSIAGVATHNPGVTIPELAGYDKVEVVMAPINKMGKYMSPSAERTLKAIQTTDKIVLGKKTLAAGSLGPKDALEYVSEFVYGVAIGITSSQELRETFGIARELWGVSKT